MWKQCSKRVLRALFPAAAVLIPALAFAEPSLTGQTGLINMPDARMAPDGAWRFGLSYADPYVAGWSSVTILPRVEVSGRYTRIKGVPGFGPNDPRSKTYGDFKDKSFDGKLLLLKEGEYLPSLALGAQDFLGTQIFTAQYLAASKRLGPVDVTLGVGRKRIDGAFGGVRYYPESLKRFSFVAEYDANDYRLDPGSNLSGAARREKGVSYGVEYQWGWLGAQLSRQHDEFGLMGYVTIPLNEKEFIPKLTEPAPYAEVKPRPTPEQWLDDPAHQRRMVAALLRQDFRNVRVAYGADRVEAILTNARISLVSRAVGRAARTILLLSPIGTREIKITYTVLDLPVATYTFFDANKLQRYLNGLLSRREFAEFVDIDYTAPAEYDAMKDRAEMLQAFDEPAGLRLLYGKDGDVVSLAREDSLLNRVRIQPAISTYLNDPSGAFHYEIAAHATYDRHLGDKLFLNLAADLTLLEDVSDVTQASNSALPHVRSDVAEYKQAGRLKLTRALLNRHFQPAERVYARASAGLYEEMYGGAGGQVLYLPRGARWGVDLSMDWLKQRDFKGTGFRDYSTVTALASAHYRLPLGIQATARAGRFLARDSGARFELKRRFLSGYEIGVWYTFTDGNDITSPGSPGNPYHDKGIFLSIPLNTMLTADTQATGSFSLSPWTRDVGQMVTSPADLYGLMEKPLVLDVHERDGLVKLGDREDDYNLPSLGASIFERPILDLARADLGHGGAVFSDSRSWRAIGVGAGLTALSAVFDNGADVLAKRYQDRNWAKGLRRAGNALPFVALAGAALLSIDGTNPRLSDTAYTAVQSGLAAGALALAGKYAVGRSRPEAGLGRTNFESFKGSDGSFPSTHTAIAWGALTPFAREYELPWLYGVATMTNLGRVIQRRHWLSDTVGGALIGYGLGNFFWDSHREARRGEPRVLVGPNAVALSWETR